MLNLFKPFLSFILLALFACHPESGFGGSGNNKQVIKTIIKESVVIQVDLDGWKPIGSGTLIKDSRIGWGIVTAEHVANAMPENKKRACFIEAPEECAELDDFYLDNDDSMKSDWAIYPIEAAPKGMRPANISHENVEVGDDIFQVGCPEGRVAFVNPGMISWVYNDLYIANGFALPGSSGGGVFNQKGYLIGITIATPIFNNIQGEPETQPTMPIITPIKNIKIL